jgi:hypothetical protein
MEIKDLTEINLNNLQIFKNNDENEEARTVINIWNEYSKKRGLPKVFYTKIRERHILAKLKKDNFNFMNILREIEKSDFLKGYNTEWKVTFDWIFCFKENFLKILEGKYRNPVKVNINEKFAMEFLNENN